MGRVFWILMGLLGAVLIALILTNDQGTVFGIENNQFAAAASMALWGGLVATAVLGRGIPFRDTLKQIVVWLGIILVLMALYVFRYDLQDVGSRLTAGIIPGSPISRSADDGANTVTLIRSPNGHFEAQVELNGADARVLVDTGATGIVLSADDARAAGIDTDTLAYTIVTRTANGTGRAARARLDTLDIGTIRRRNVPVIVAQPGRLDTTLLGQQFLESLLSYERRGDRLTLRD